MASSFMFQPHSVSVQVGLMEYSYSNSRYKLSKGTKDKPHAGPQTKKWLTSDTIDKVEREMKDLFYSKKEQQRHTFFVGNYNGEKMENNTIAELWKDKSGQKRLYLFSKLVKYAFNILHTFCIITDLEK